ncbi:hypothetical protein O6H91_21G055600 [Diphasiastrum complanatum]|uniref:Uncharacterized protein n=1 Tax=Diphasiastrum complanatum TaxID=34168 RepID=A0ACC2ALV1_DIPCM|nr:hypothetical protein O6H91_21G055600 [Diphasiastrum complanatum]
MAKLLFRRISLVLVIGVIVADAVDLAGYEFSDDPTDENTSDKKDSGESGSSSNSGSGFGSGYGLVEIQDMLAVPVPSQDQDMVLDQDTATVQDLMGLLVTVMAMAQALEAE